MTVCRKQRTRPTIEKDDTGIGQELCADVHAFLLAAGDEQNGRVGAFSNAQLIDDFLDLSQLVLLREMIRQPEKGRVRELLLHRELLEEQILLEDVGEFSLHASVVPLIVEPDITRHTVQGSAGQRVQQGRFATA